MAGRLLYVGDNPVEASVAKQANDEIVSLETLIKHIQDALGTAEEGDALVEVARNAHKAEQELAAIDRHRSHLSLVTKNSIRE